MIYAEALEKAGLHEATEKILQRFPHLSQLAQTDAKSFANDVCHLVAVDGVSIEDYWKLGSIAAGSKMEAANGAKNA